MVLGDLRKSLDKLDIIAAKFTGFYKHVNGIYMDYYFNEVRRDVRYFKDQLKDAKFERDRNNFFQDRIKKYKENYCPSACYRFFSPNNQSTYACLRSDIDDLLNLNEQDVIL